MQLHEYTAHELTKLLRSGEVSSTELTQALLERIEETEPNVNAYITVMAESALEQAAHADKLLKNGGGGTLCGLPVGIKDNMCIKGVRTTCASRMLEDFVPPYDANVIELLKAQGVVFLGKCNMDEFAMGSSTETSYFGPTSNPHDLSRVPGGSSGGSAAAVAAGTAVMALGSDTGGSIRQPASLSGVVGMKPTYGMVSRYGLIAFASSLDQIGPLTRSVRDCAMMLDAIAKGDRRDSTSIMDAGGGFEAQLERDMKGMHIGLPKEYFAEGVDEEIRHTVLEAVKTFESMGAVCEECSLPLAEYALMAYYLVSSAEASSNLARYDGVRYGHRAEHAQDHEEMFIKSRGEGFGREVKRRIMLGAYVLSAGYYDAYYKKAQQVRTLIMRDYAKLFEKYDFLLTPASPTTAWTAGARINDPLKMYAADMCTVPLNIAGLPGLVAPCGKSVDGLPIGMQFIGPPRSDGLILSAGYAYEQASGNGVIRPVPVGGDEQ
ncbi:MAG: Asp-tRNA(Asn)/Glu-tRNA(Gln) amidotransferase subunit GatA [Bacillota bacterium]